jgi:TolB protein
VIRRALAFAVVLAAAAMPAAAQDSVPQPGGVRLTLRYDPGNRPSLVIVPGAGLDSVRTILKRDLDFSDRFTTIIQPEAESVAAGPAAPLNYGLYKNFGAAFALELVQSAGQTTLRLHDVNAGKVINTMDTRFADASDPALRMQVHRASDEVVRWVTGTPGVAATRIAYVAGGRIMLMDFDGAAITALTSAGQTALSPAWSPTSDRIAYTRLGEGKGPVLIQLLSGGAPQMVPGSESALNITPMFSPDGQFLAYAQSGEQGTNIQVANVRDMCCLQRLTTGRFADNLSPTYAPDGQRIAFVSTRAGPPQIYVMDANGTDAELLVPFDFGVTGSSNAPEWSPDGVSLAFHREVSGGPQIFVLDVAGRRLKQLSSSGRNEDPTWAPDGRHIAFVSDRTGLRQIWVIDIETGRVRAINTGGTARLPAWSRRLP